MRLYRNNIAAISAATISDVTSTGMAVAGTVVWYKGDAVYGVAYKKHSVTTWSYKEASSADISVSLTSLSANTNYDIALYCKWNNEYQLGAITQQKTSASE